jgi:hypothetical protein
VFVIAADFYKSRLSEAVNVHQTENKGIRKIMSPSSDCYGVACCVALLYFSNIMRQEVLYFQNNIYPFIEGSVSAKNRVIESAGIQL